MASRCAVRKGEWGSVFARTFPWLALGRSLRYSEGDGGNPQGETPGSLFRKKMGDATPRKEARDPRVSIGTRGCLSLRMKKV